LKIIILAAAANIQGNHLSGKREHVGGEFFQLSGKR